VSACFQYACMQHVAGWITSGSANTHETAPRACARCWAWCGGLCRHLSCLARAPHPRARTPHSLRFRCFDVIEVCLSACRGILGEVVRTCRRVSNAACCASRIHAAPLRRVSRHHYCVQHQCSTACVSCCTAAGIRRRRVARQPPSSRLDHHSRSACTAVGLGWR
jgi:hypothetical protein